MALHGTGTAARSWVWLGSWMLLLESEAWDGGCGGWVSDSYTGNGSSSTAFIKILPDDEECANLGAF